MYERCTRHRCPRLAQPPRSAPLPSTRRWPRARAAHTHTHTLTHPRSHSRTHTGRRDGEEGEDGKKGMEDWDQAELEAAIAAKHGADNTNRPTEIVCKFFLDAVEKKVYGWCVRAQRTERITARRSAARRLQRAEQQTVYRRGTKRRGRGVQGMSGGRTVAPPAGRQGVRPGRPLSTGPLPSSDPGMCPSPPACRPAAGSGRAPTARTASTATRCRRATCSRAR